MTSHCETVAERVAFGEPLGELADHVAGCVHCKRLMEMPGRLGATRREIDPGLGFSARMTMGAQQRLVIRRRRRLAAGLAASVAAGALGVVVMARSPSEPATPPAPETQVVKDEPPVQAEEADLQMLVGVADTAHTTRMSANWKSIEKRLAPYRKLVKETP